MKKFENLPLRINKVRQQVDNILSQISWTPAVEAKLELELEKLLSLEENYWKNKSRVD